MRKHNIGPSISTNTMEFFGKNFKTVNAGASYALESFPVLYRRTLATMKGKFTEGELRLMLEVSNKLPLTPSIAGRHMAALCFDGIALDGTDNKWKVDPLEIDGKFKLLSDFEIAILEVWANSFWQGMPTKGKGVEKYVNQLK